MWFPELDIVPRWGGANPMGLVPLNAVCAGPVGRDLVAGLKETLGGAWRGETARLPESRQVALGRRTASPLPMPALCTAAQRCWRLKEQADGLGAVKVFHHQMESVIPPAASPLTGGA